MSASEPVRRTREQRKLDRREAILAAARSAFARRGYQGASIGEIAQATGIAEGTIYKYFTNKQDLLFHVMRQFYEGLIADVEAEVMRLGCLPDRLRFIVRRQLEAFVEDRDLCRLFIRELRTADDYTDSPLHELNRRYTSIVVRVLEAGMASGEMRPEIQPRLVRDMLYGSIEHIAWRSASRDVRLRIDVVTEQILEVILRGLMDAPSARRSAARRGK